MLMAVLEQLEQVVVRARLTYGSKMPQEWNKKNFLNSELHIFPDELTRLQVAAGEKKPHWMKHHCEIMGGFQSVLSLYNPTYCSVGTCVVGHVNICCHLLRN